MKKLFSLFILTVVCLTAQNPITSNGAILSNNFNATVTASTTNYVAFGPVGLVTTEGSRQIPVPFACSAGNLTVQTSSGQSSTGTLVITLRKNGASTGVVVTLAANAAAGVYSDHSDVAAFAAGDLMGLQLINNGTSQSAGIVSISLSCR